MRFAAIILLGAACVGPVLADTITLPLPGLTGGYEADPYAEPNPGYPQARTVDLTMPFVVTAIDQLELVVSGTWHAGEVTCDDGSGPQTSPFLPDVGLYLTSDAFVGDWFGASIATVDGELVEASTPVTSCCPPGVLDYAVLIGAELQLELSVAYGIIGICWVSEDSWGELTEVALRITGTVVATEGGTWSALKTLYR